MSSTTSGPTTSGEFEAYVRQVSKVKWAGVEGGSERIAGTQIDGVFRRSGTTYLVEATIERSINKVRVDINKLATARASEERTAYTVECWMVTLSEPTPDQRAAAEANRVRLVSIDDYLAPVLCHVEYAHMRPRHRFGSVADPVGEPGAEVERINTPITNHLTGTSVTVAEIESHLRAGRIVIVLGDYGAGKSLLCRELYRSLDAWHTRPRVHFPIAVNLREHWGSVFGQEVFGRHAQLLACQLDSGGRLYHAWLEGFATLLLDGFDEIAPQPWSSDQRGLAQIRRRAVAPIRDLVENRPKNSGLLIAGRMHYFASTDELVDALGLPKTNLAIVELRQLTKDEAAAFVKEIDPEASVSDWIPRRPLFLSYLSRTGMLDSFARVSADDGAASAWIDTLNMVCKRESEVSIALDGRAVLQILGNVACKLRESQDRLGPINDIDLSEAFLASTTYQPDNDAWAILQRLPGITFRVGGSEKWMVDEDWADALNGIWLCSTLQRGEVRQRRGRILHALGELGQIVAAQGMRRISQGPKEILSWCHQAVRAQEDPTLVADAFMVLSRMDEEVDCGGLEIRGAHFGEVDLADVRCTNVHLVDCTFDLLAIDDLSRRDFVIECAMIDKLVGLGTGDDLPDWMEGSEALVRLFPATNSAVLETGWPLGVRLGMAVLRKLYIQRGRGRLKSALTRGLRQDHRGRVDAVLKVLQQQGMLRYRTGKIRKSMGEFVHPVPERRAEVLRLLERAPDLREAPWSELKGISDT